MLITLGFVTEWWPSITKEVIFYIQGSTDYDNELRDISFVKIVLIGTSQIFVKDLKKLTQFRKQSLGVGAVRKKQNQNKYIAHTHTHIYIYIYIHINT